MMSFLKKLFGGSIPENVEVLEASNFKKLITNKRVQLIDVRTKSEYDLGHLDSAINIDFFKKKSFKSKFEKLNKNKPIYIYCKSGGRSGNASKVLSGIGFSKIYDLKGGYMAL